MTFDADNRRDALAHGFGNLELLNESVLEPAGRIPRYAHEDAEIVTYVREGTLAYEDGAGRPGYARAGEFRRMTAGFGFRHQEMNASGSSSAHVFHIVLRVCDMGVEPLHEQRHFSAAERRGRLGVVASPDGRAGSLQMHQDTFVFSALLAPGGRVVHALAKGRSAWIQVVTGEVTVFDQPMWGGDGMALEDESTVSVTALDGAEILLVDMGSPRVGLEG
jgi:redox-sensitive bicupin YhaK (pirin superfamily)